MRTPRYSSLQHAGVSEQQLLRCFDSAHAPFSFLFSRAKLYTFHSVRAQLVHQVSHDVTKQPGCLPLKFAIAAWQGQLGWNNPAPLVHVFHILKGRCRSRARTLTQKGCVSESRRETSDPAYSSSAAAVEVCSVPTVLPRLFLSSAAPSWTHTVGTLQM